MAIYASNKQANCCHSSCRRRAWPAAATLCNQIKLCSVATRRIAAEYVRFGEVSSYGQCNLRSFPIYILSMAANHIVSDVPTTSLAPQSVNATAQQARMLQGFAGKSGSADKQALQKGLLYFAPLRLTLYCRAAPSRSRSLCQLRTDSCSPPLAPPPPLLRQPQQGLSPEPQHRALSVTD